MKCVAILQLIAFLFVFAGSYVSSSLKEKNTVVRETL